RHRRILHAGYELIAQPLQAEPRALRDAHHVPLAGNSMAESVDPSARIVRDLLHVREDDAGGADGTRHNSRFDDAVADSARSLIAGAPDYGRSRSEASRGRGRGGDTAGDF